MFKVGRAGADPAVRLSAHRGKARRRLYQEIGNGVVSVSDCVLAEELILDRACEEPRLEQRMDFGPEWFSHQGIRQRCYGEEFWRETVRALESAGLLTGVLQ